MAPLVALVTQQHVDAGLAISHGVGQVEGLTHQLEVELVFLEREDAGNALVEVEQSRSAQRCRGRWCPARRSPDWQRRCRRSRACW